MQSWYSHSYDEGEYWTDFDIRIQSYIGGHRINQAPKFQSECVWNRFQRYPSIILMQPIVIPLNPADKDIQTLRILFKKYSKEKPGRLTPAELSHLILELANRPMPYQINQLFQTLPNLIEVGLDEDCFVVWYLAFNVRLPWLTTLFINLKDLEAQIQSAAPAQVNDQSVKHSYAKFESETNTAELTNEFGLDILLSSQKTKARLDHYQSILKKLISPAAIVFSFQVNGNAGEIKQKVQGLVSLGMELMKQLAQGSEDIFKLINISCGNTDTQVILVIETQYPLFTLIAQEFNNLINNINPNIMVESQLLIKSNSISKVLSNTHQGLSSSLSFNFKIDSFLLQRIRQTVAKMQDKSEPLALAFGLLLQQFRLQVKTNNIQEHFQSVFGIPPMNLSGQASVMIKQQVNVQEIIQNFLPEESQELVSIIRNAESTDMKVDVFMGYLNVRLGLRLNGTNQLFDLIM